MGQALDDSTIRSLHGLRGLMAWWVVVGHLSRGFDWNLPLIGTPTLAVDVFILLSGFVIAMLIARKNESYAAFVTRRAFRLFPLYLPVLLLSAALLPLQREVWAGFPASIDTYWRIRSVDDALANLPFHLGLHIPLLQGVVPVRLAPTLPSSVLGQAWSVSLEWQFYLLAPLLVSTLRTRAWLKAGAMIAVLIFLARYFSVAFLGAKLPLFVIGIATFLALDPRMRRSALVIAALCVAHSLKRYGASQLIPLGLWAAVILSTFSTVGTPQRFLARMLETDLAVRMGQISYSIYLLHMIPFFAAVYACRAAGMGTAASETIVSVVTIMATYLAALASYRFIEQPGMRLGSRLAHSWGFSTLRAETKPGV